MINLRTLIVEDSTPSRRYIRNAINEYNTLSDGICFSEIYEAYNYESACDVIIRERDDFDLILLDIDYRETKDGFDIIRRFPQLSYAVITEFGENALKGYNDLRKPNIYFFKNKQGGAPMARDVIFGLEKFVEDKKAEGGFFSRKELLNRRTIYWNNVAIISRTLLQLQHDGIIDKCKQCSQSKVHEAQKDRTKFYSGAIDLEADTSHRHLAFHYASGYSMKSLIKELRLNPEQFIQIDQSTIVNLAYARKFHEDEHTLSIQITERNTVYHAKLRGVEDYFDEKAIDRISKYPV
jgi:DNA-binding LytR/AlgR family response regulator